MKKSRSFCHDGVGVCLATVAVSYASCYAVVAKVSHKFFCFFFICVASATLLSFQQCSNQNMLGKLSYA